MLIKTFSLRGGYVIDAAELNVNACKMGVKERKKERMKERMKE
jgi:hypothetical protein